MDILIDYFKKGIIKPIIDKVYPLNEVPEALRKIGEGKVKGKLISNG